MTEVLVARQPIFDRRLRVVAYELLFRDGDTNAAVFGDPEAATAMVALNSFTEIGLERIVGTRSAWINVSRKFLLGGLVRSMPPGLVSLEILEDQVIDRALISAV